MWHRGGPSRCGQPHCPRPWAAVAAPPCPAATDVEVCSTHIWTRCSRPLSPFPATPLAWAASRVCRLMRMLISMAQHLDAVPDERYLFMKLSYTDATPDGYEPPYFQPAQHRAVGYFPRKPFHMYVCGGPGRGPARLEGGAEWNGARWARAHVPWWAAPTRAPECCERAGACLPPAQSAGPRGHQLPRRGTCRELGAGRGGGGCGRRRALRRRPEHDRDGDCHGARHPHRWRSQHGQCVR